MKKTIVRSIAISMLILGFLTNSVSLKIGKPVQPTNQQIIHNKQKIQNITGKFLIGPDLGEERIHTVQTTAKQKLRGQVYNITDKRIIALLKEKAQEQTDIKIIMENEQYRQYKNYFRDIKNQMSNHTTFQLKNDRLMNTNFVHSKFFLTDTASLIQTNNLTHAGLFKNKEHLFITYNTDIHESLSTIFLKDRNGETIELTDIHPNLLICNINCRPIIENTLQSAKEKIYIQTQYITDPSILDIIQQKQSNIETKIIVADTNTNDDLTYYLQPAIQKRYNHKPYLHTKMIYVDDKYLIIGSINLSKNSLDNNREVAIILTDSDHLQKFRTDFLYDRSKL